MHVFSFFKITNSNINNNSSSRSRKIIPHMPHPYSPLADVFVKTNVLNYSYARLVKSLQGERTQDSKYSENCKMPVILHDLIIDLYNMRCVSGLSLHESSWEWFVWSFHINWLIMAVIFANRVFKGSFLEIIWQPTQETSTFRFPLLFGVLFRNNSLLLLSSEIKGNLPFYGDALSKSMQCFSIVFCKSFHNGEVLYLIRHTTYYNWKEEDMFVFLKTRFWKFSLLRI